MTNPDSTGNRWSRRRMYAEVALKADLPAPVTVSFAVDILSLDFDTIAEGQRWAEFFGITTTQHLNKDRTRRLLGARGQIDWHGWPVQLHAGEDVTPDTGLDDETADHLRAIDPSDEAEGGPNHA